MCTANNMSEAIAKILHGGGRLEERTRIQCIVKSTFSETKLVPALNDLLIANPSPASVSRFRMGWMDPIDISNRAPLMDGERKGQAISSLEERASLQCNQYGTISRFSGVAYGVRNSLNVWSSGIWLSTSTGSTAAMKAGGGKPMDMLSTDLQYLIREHMIEQESDNADVEGMDNGFLRNDEFLHLRWNSQTGKIFIDGSHLTHNLELGDEILINSNAPPLHIFVPEDSL